VLGDILQRRVVQGLEFHHLWSSRCARATRTNSFWSLLNHSLAVVHSLELRFEDPAVADLLGVRDPVPQDKRVLEGLPSLVAERDLELLPEPIPGRLVDGPYLLVELEVLLALFDRSVRKREFGSVTSRISRSTLAPSA
jgi:hypothetical protein